MIEEEEKEEIEMEDRLEVREERKYGGKVIRMIELKEES